MKLLYDNNTGEIYYTVYDTDWFGFSHTTNISLTEFEIDELLPDNQEICQDLVGTRKRVDADNNMKYSIEVDEFSILQLYMLNGWEEYFKEEDYV